MSNNNQNSLAINLEYCYGISKLKTEFDFSKVNVHIIYAPNGCMKTSFAKTFHTIANGEQPKDEVFIERKTVCEIMFCDKALLPSQVFVVEPFSDSYSSLEKMGTLLVNQSLKKRYTNLVNSIEKIKIEIFKKIKQISGSSNAEAEICAIYANKNIFDSLIKLREEVNSAEYISLDYKYGDIVNPKVQEFLKKNVDLISIYIARYSELINNSKFFKRGIFGTDNASGVKKSLSDNNFFIAQHKLILKDQTIIEKSEDLENIINSEKSRIIKDAELIRQFEKIDAEITKNAELKKLKSILETQPTILVEISNYENFKKKLWINYFANDKTNFNSLLDQYVNSQKEIDEITSSAISERTEWGDVIDLFNNRFNVPFKLKILNQDDVILKNKITPNIGFSYEQGHETKVLEENAIKKILSTGEQRALYLLNVIFEIRVREKEGHECVLILDDIADSFDYKNKYAIIEYLKDISNNHFFKIIILTHNFDFYRTVASRLPIKRENCFMTIKTDSEIKIVRGNYIKNVFNVWVKNLETDQAIFIASIPFVRNLIEYINGEENENYKKLTNLLHIMDSTKKFYTNDLVNIYKAIWPQKIFNYQNNLVYELLINEADKINAENSEQVQLENKIILSLAIRLLAEEFMIHFISDKAAISDIKNNQTKELFKLYKNEFSQNTDEIKIIDQVNLMTAENIHINSFMYEPILDLSDDHLKKLYSKIKSRVSTLGVKK